MFNIQLFLKPSLPWNFFVCAENQHSEPEFVNVWGTQESIPPGYMGSVVFFGPLSLTSDFCGNVNKFPFIIWCGVAQLVARRLAVRQARVRFSARHHREVPPLSKQAMKKWRVRPQRMATDKCDCMNVCMYVIKIWKINKKSGIMPPNIYYLGLLEFSQTIGNLLLKCSLNFVSNDYFCESLSLYFLRRRVWWQVAANLLSSACIQERKERRRSQARGHPRSKTGS